MPYKLVEMNELDSGSFYFVIHYWLDAAAMNSGKPPDWENDFITDLDRLAGKAIWNLKLSNDPVSRVSKMQRADTLEWIPTDEWTREDGLLARGIKPAFESHQLDSGQICGQISDAVARFEARRQMAIASSAAWSGSSSYVNPVIRSEPDRKANLHSDLRLQIGIAVEAI